METQLPIEIYPNPRLTLRKLRGDKDIYLICDVLGRVLACDGMNEEYITDLLDIVGGLIDKYRGTPHISDLLFDISQHPACTHDQRLMCAAEMERNDMNKDDEE